MPQLRRQAVVDPHSAARLAGLRPGWVPPGPGLPHELSLERSWSPPRQDGAAPGVEPGVDRAADLILPAEELPSGGVGPEHPAGASARDRTHRERSSALDRWGGSRLDPGRRGVVALALLAALSAGLAAFVVLRSQPEDVTPPTVVASGSAVPGTAGAGGAAPGGAPSSGAQSPGKAAGGAELVVSVGGTVSRPGLVRLPSGSRVDDAVRAAGGALPGADLTGVNLAARLVDGEQILVGLPGVAPGPTGGAAGGSDDKVDLNAATVAQLDALPGIGPVLAQRIVDWRRDHGRFGSLDQLREVGGIGESKYAQIEPKVRV